MEETPAHWHGSADWPPTRWRASDGWRLNDRRAPRVWTRPPTAEDVEWLESVARRAGLA